MRCEKEEIYHITFSNDELDSLIIMLHNAKFTQDPDQMNIELYENRRKRYIASFEQYLKDY